MTEETKGMSENDEQVMQEEPVNEKEENAHSENDKHVPDRKASFFRLKNKIKEQEEKNAELKDKYLRLFAEFDNFKKRSAREWLEKNKEAGKDVIRDFLPILDDFERAMKTAETTENVQALKEGFELIQNKLQKTLEQKGLEKMNSLGEPFDPEKHEAITEIPAPSEDMKGKVLDDIEKGYLLNGKIIRYAKVVVGK